MAKDVNSPEAKAIKEAVSPFVWNLITKLNSDSETVLTKEGYRIAFGQVQQNTLKYMSLYGQYAEGANEYWFNGPSSNVDTEIEFGAQIEEDLPSEFDPITAEQREEAAQDLETSTEAKKAVLDGTETYKTDSKVDKALEEADQKIASIKEQKKQIESDLKEETKKAKQEKKDNSAIDMRKVAKKEGDVIPETKADGPEANDADQKLNSVENDTETNVEASAETSTEAVTQEGANDGDVSLEVDAEVAQNVNEKKAEEAPQAQAQKTTDPDAVAKKTYDYQIRSILATIIQQLGKAEGITGKQWLDKYIASFQRNKQDYTTNSAGKKVRVGASVSLSPETVNGVKAIIYYAQHSSVKDLLHELNHVVFM